MPERYNLEIFITGGKYYLKKKCNFFHKTSIILVNESVLCIERYLFFRINKKPVLRREMYFCINTRNYCSLLTKCFVL